MNDGNLLTDKRTDGYVTGFECRYRLIKALNQDLDGQIRVSN